MVNLFFKTDHGTLKVLTGDNKWINMLIACNTLLKKAVPT